MGRGAHTGDRRVVEPLVALCCSQIEQDCRTNGSINMGARQDCEMRIYHHATRG